MGYTTKFNIGDTVYYAEEETIWGKNCECCNGRLPSEKVKKVHRSSVVDIYVNKSFESYNLAAVRSLTSNKLYATKAEAEKSL